MHHQKPGVDHAATVLANERAFMPRQELGRVGLLQRRRMPEANGAALLQRRLSFRALGRAVLGNQISFVVATEHVAIVPFCPLLRLRQCCP